MSEVLVWQFATPQRCISSAPSGGGLGLRSWVMNAQVALGYSRTDIDRHVRELALWHGCVGDGVGMLTAASIEDATTASEDGVEVWATVGLSLPTWAADETGAATVWHPGTVNLFARMPERLSDAALVNAVITATEAKTQALVDAGVPGTGTASDAVCIVCPPGGRAEPFGGPRSRPGAPLARAVHAAVAKGIVR